MGIRSKKFWGCHHVRLSRGRGGQARRNVANPRPWLWLSPPNTSFGFSRWQGGGLMLFAAEDYAAAEKLVLQDPLVANECVDWSLNGWVADVGDIELTNGGAWCAKAGSVAASAALVVVGLPRPVTIWLAILAVATFAKNEAKRRNPFQQKMRDAGECPWPFVFFHDPVHGLRKYARLNMLCAALLALRNRVRITRWLVGLVG